MTFAGGDYGEVGRWLDNAVRSHAKRESPRVEVLTDAEGEREGRSYGVRLRLGDRLLPAADEPAMELSYAEVAQNRGSMAWCAELAGRIRALARRLLQEERGARTSA
jgi:hypothetical protein